MAKNSKLNKAKKAKNDEFYTQFEDIAKEMNAYLEYNPDIFKGKTIMCPCDIPGVSNFTKYFAESFERLGLKKLISTCYVNGLEDYIPSEYELSCPQYDETKSKYQGKVLKLVLEHDVNGDGKIDYNDIQWDYLKGNGDFRSAEVTELRDEADFIFTNPPFSLFREFINWLMESGKQFSVIGNLNTINCRELFPYIANNKMWLGSTGRIQPIFEVPKRYEDICTVFEVNNKLYSKGPACAWYTNIDHGLRHEKLILITMYDNKQFNSRLIKHCKKKEQNIYQKFDNVDVIEVPFVSAIPSDYEGYMAVPITVMEKFNPEQFEIIDLMKSTMVIDKMNVNDFIKKNKLSCLLINEKPIYARLIIRNKHPQK